MIDVRLRSRISPDELGLKVGKIVTPDDVNLVMTGPTTLRRPDGALLAIYLPGVLRDVMAEAWDSLSRVRVQSVNRGAASGSLRVQQNSIKHTKSKSVHSSLLGAFDAYGRDRFCRLTAFTAKEPESWGAMQPVWRAIARQFEAHVPDRYRNQAAECAKTHPDWIIGGTPFTTVTINNTYPTGVHQDKGDLDAGFSCLAVTRRGDYTGGLFTWPEYRVGVDLQDGDLVLMDSHEWHGNTWLHCSACGARLDKPGHRCETMSLPGPERVSVVCYYRTKMTACASLDEESAKRAIAAEARNEARFTVEAEA
jgi:hypothetical protein